jgi:hypothetical protein
MIVPNWLPTYSYNLIQLSHLSRDIGAPAQICQNLRSTSRLRTLYSFIGHEGSVGLSVCKVHIFSTRWRLFTLTAVALHFCRATAVLVKKTPSSVGNKRRATAKSLKDLP